MAEDKLTIATLRKILAQKADCTEDVAGTFLTSLFPVIIAGLKEDKQVRINGLGTFKLQWNEPRKSVNIRTGETIVIEGYNKVVFTPETSLKEQINEPFAHLEPIYLDGNAPAPPHAPIDPMQKFSEQAEDIKDILAELSGLQDEVITEPQEEITEEVVEEEQQEPTTSKPKDPEKKPFNAWLVAGITMLVFCIFLVGSFFFLQHKIVSWADSLLEKSQAVAVVTEEDTEDTETVIEIETIENAEPVVTEQTKQTEDIPIVSPTQQRTYTEFIKTETLTEGSRLTWLSRKYYGAPDFWVYIYEANKTILPNPNAIPIGTKIRIPKLPASLIDTKNAESMQQAQTLHNQILGN